MIILPLNEEARNGRRIPWVTLTLVAACFVVFLHTGAADVAVDAEVDERLDTAWEYFALHPYVKVDADASLMLGEGAVASVAQTFRLEHQASGSPPIPDFVLHHDQVEFDHRMDQVYTALESHSFFRFGFFPDTLASPDSTFLSYVFVHEDWLHLLANVALLLLAGIFLEEVFGRALFAVFVATSAVAAAAGYALLDPEAGEALGGASGVAAALAGAFLVRFAGTPIRFRYFYIPPFGGKFTAKGWITLPIYGGFYFAVDYLLTHGAPGIEAPDTEFATWAHVGGMVWGIGFALVLKLLRIEERFIHPGIERSLVTQSNPVLERALAAREEGRVEEAVELLAGEVARHPGNRDACLAYWDAATAAGRPEQATDAAIRVLRDEVTAREKDLAVQHWRELTQRVPDARIDAAVEVRVAGFLAAASEIELALFSAERILDGRCGVVAAPVLQRLARTMAELDPPTSLRAARAALDTNDLDAADREALEALVARLDGGKDAGPAPAEDPTAGAAEDEDDSAQLFDSDFDLDRHGDAPASTAADRAALESGDALNAAPFELDDSGDDLANADAHPGVADYALEDAPLEVEALDTAGAPPEVAAAVLEHGSFPLESEGDPGAAPDATGPVFADPLDPMDLAATQPATAETPAAAADLATDPALDAGPDPDPPSEDEPAPELAPEPSLEPALELAPEPSLEPAPDLEPEPSLEPAPDLEPEPSLEPALDLDPESSLEPALDLDPESLLEPAPDLEPEPSLAPAPDPEPEPAGSAPLAVDPVEPLPAPPAAPEPGPLALPELELPAAAAPRALKRMNAIPLKLADGSLTLDVGERGKATLGLDRVDAIAVAGVHGLKTKPIVLIDLITNWTSDASQPLKIVRLRSDRFDPRNLVDAPGNGLVALKAWIAALLEQSGAMPLPDADAAAGSPFQMHADLETYEREILRAL